MRVLCVAEKRRSERGLRKTTYIKASMAKSITQILSHGSYTNVSLNICSLTQASVQGKTSTVEILIFCIEFLPASFLQTLLRHPQSMLK